MLNLLLEHAPHIVPAIVVGGAIMWLYLRDLRTEPSTEEKERLEQWRADEQHKRTQRLPQRSVARTAIVVLATLVAVLATSVVLFVQEILGGPHLDVVVWAHVAVGVFLCGLVIAKLRAIGRARLRRALRFESLFRVSTSLVLTTSLLPLLVTGTILIFDPSTTGFAARLHLLVAVWFGVLALAHTIKLAPSTLARLRRSEPAHSQPSPPGGGVPPPIVSSSRPLGASALRHGRQLHHTQPITREGKV